MVSGAFFIKKSADYKRVMKEGRKRISPHLVLYVADQDPVLGQSRLGLSISKANIPLATRRNRIKRLIRDVWQNRSERKLVKDAVLVVKKGTDKVKNDSLIAEITYILNKYLS